MRFFLFQFDDVAPARGGIGTAEIVLDGIGKHVCLSLAVAPRVLLTAQDDGLRAVDPVDSVDDGIQSFHLFKLLRIDVEKVLLDWTVRTYSHHDDAGLFILIATAIYPFQHFCGGLDDGCRGTGRGDDALLLEIPVLRQILPEGIGVHEDAHHRGHGLLHP